MLARGTASAKGGDVTEHTLDEGQRIPDALGRVELPARRRGTT
jgi:hypothetical protein